MRNRLDTIQALRAFAAFAVVFYHTIEAISRSYPEGALPTRVMDFAWLGNFGVDVFFVISGFIMIYAHYDDFNVKGARRNFILNRLKRIVPNYWLLTTIGVLVLWLMPSLSHHGRTFDVEWIIASYLFIPWTSEAGIPLPVLGLGWTLNYEIYFYFLFSFSLLFRRNLGISILAMVLLSSVFIGSFFEAERPLLKQVSSWLLLEFLTGVALGMAFKNRLGIPSYFGVICLCMAVLILSSTLDFRENGSLPQFLRFVFFGIPALMIVMALTLSNRITELRMPDFVVLLGNASYALYLTHVFTLPAAIKLLSFYGIKPPIFISVVILMMLSISVAILFYKLLERPSQAFLRSVKQTSRS